MAELELVLPAMGEGIIEATITKWLVNEGDQIEEDQPVLEIATDKVDSEIPAPATGIISKIIKAEGEVVPIGDIIAIIETDPLSQDSDNKKVRNTLSRTKEQENRESPENSQTGKESLPPLDLRAQSKNKSTVPNQTSSGKFITPLVRSIAAKENIPAEELESIGGSGESGRITKSDILNYIEYKRNIEKGSNNNVAAQTTAGKFKENPETKKTEKEYSIPGDGDQVIEMDRIRKLISDHMINSKKTSAHVTSFIDADVTELAKWREANKKIFQNRENQKLTYTPFFIMAVAKALRDHPMVNISVAGKNIIVKKDVNIGMAVAMANGNLIVPVIKNADEKSLTGMVKTVNDMAERGRNNQLQPHETKGGTFTITNFGTFKNTTGTPIINQPEAAILGTGAIIKKPVVIETAQGDVIGIRHMMTLSLSYDHRVIDGALGGMFLAKVADYLEKFNPGQTI